MNKLKTFLIMFALALFSNVCAIKGHAELVDQIIVVVNGEIITESNLNNLWDERHLYGDPELERLRTREETLEYLVDKTLIDQEGVEIGLSVTGEMVDREIERLRQRLGLDKDGFKSGLHSEGVKYELYREQIRFKMLAGRVFSEVLGAAARPDEETLREYYLSNAADFTTGHKVRLAHIQLTGTNAGQVAADVKQQVADGADFGELAREFSSGPMAYRGGDMGIISVSDLAPMVAEAVDGLAVGDVSEPIYTGELVHLFHVAERLDSGIAPFDEVRDKVVQHFSLRGDRRLKGLLVPRLREKAVIEYKR